LLTALPQRGEENVIARTDWNKKGDVTGKKENKKKSLSIFPRKGELSFRKSWKRKKRKREGCEGRGRWGTEGRGAQPELI